MSEVAKILEISAGSPKGIEEAVALGLKRVSKTVKGVQGAWISDIKVRTSESGAITEWRVCMRVSFIVE